MMTIGHHYQNFSISIINDAGHDIGSSDNVTQYDWVYVDADDIIYSNLSKHGVNIYTNDEKSTSVLVASAGGGTTVHKTGALFDEDKLLICCGNSIFCLGLPDLNLLWSKRSDMATCFQIFKYRDSYIIHGELQVSMISQKGELLWQMGGKDIFVSVDGRGIFEIHEDKLVVSDWENSKYLIDMATGESTIIS